jgi:competence protein ComEA
MPTPSERRALLFLSALLVLGAVARASAALRASGHPLDPAPLDRQLRAVDSARAAAAAKGKAGKTTKSPRTITRTSTGRLAPTASAGQPLLPPQGPPPKIDLDLAPASEIQRLPRIGPVLAARIVADRDSLGPFGSLQGLQRVRGVGPALSAGIAPYVTFSLPPRPPGVVAPADRAARGTGRRSRRAGGQP